MSTDRKMTISSAACLALLVLLGPPAAAEETKAAPLEDQPAVRTRYELREGRFVIGPSISFSLDRAVRHAATFGLRMEYHITDYFSVAADAGYGVGFNTGLASEIEDTYYHTGDKTSTGSAACGSLGNTDGLDTCWDDLQKRMADIVFAGDVRFAFTPIYGRIAIFSKLFVLYDMYAFLGFAMAYTQNDIDDAGVDEANEGFRPGMGLGVGMHVYFNHWIALGLEIKDLMFEDNETGRDQTLGLSEKEIQEFQKCKGSPTCVITPVVDADDRQFTQHWFFGFNLTFFLPIEPKVSR